MKKSSPLFVMIAGPYGSGTKTQAEKKANLDLLNQAALAVFKRGHIPVVGVVNALPLIEIEGESNFDSIMMPLSLALAEKCDCCLRIGGESEGADREVGFFKSSNKPVYYDSNDLP